MAVPLLAFIVPAVAGIVSAAMQSGNNAEAQRAIEEAVEKYGPEARALIEQELGGPGAMAEVYGERLAPEAAAAQRRALQQLQQVAETGYTPEEEAALRRIQAQTAAMASSQQAALQGQLQRQGVLDSGARIAMQQAAGQAAANRAGQAGLDVAAQAQRRAFQAMQQTGALGGDIRRQAFGEAEARALADERRRINRAQMQMDVLGRQAGYTADTARGRAEAANRPWQIGSEAIGRAGQTYAAYAGAPAGRRKAYDPNDPSTW